MSGYVVEIAGVGLHPFGRFEDKGLVELGATAVRDALAEAGVERAGFQAAYCGTAYGGVATGHRVLGALALTGTPIVDVEAGCASGGAALQLGAQAIADGRYDTVLVFGVEKMPKGIIRSSFFAPWQEQAGLSPAPAYFALRAQRLLADAGLTKDDLAAVCVKNRAAGANNPNAMFRKPVTAEEVLASRVVCDPLHLWMLCSPNEGAAAVVLRRAAGEGVKVRGISLRSHLPGPVLSESTPMAGLVDDSIPSATALAADDAYEQAGVGPADVDVVECQDTDAARELLSWQELRLCEPGAQKAMLDSDRAGTVNPSGGLLSKGEPLGASALGQVVELVHQLRGTANNQVDGAQVGLAHVVGRGANACVTILSR
ncbi:MAG TPA: thiolase family protein [Acidimicrobiales bacterium]|nr:thiolase family protein [Acidimicrobiales bacterium]